MAFIGLLDLEQIYNEECECWLQLYHRQRLEELYYMSSVFTPYPHYLQQHAVEPPVTVSGGSASTYYAPQPSLPPPTHHLTPGQVIERVRNRQAPGSRTPPPAHQQGEVRVPPEHVAYGGIAHHHLRPGPSAPRDMYLVQHHQLMYHHQLMRAQQEHLPPHHYHHLPPGAVRSPAIPGLETQKADQPEAGGEAMGVHSPPLELRRPASRGTRLGPVPPAHLLSPHDRCTDSPQVATVYGGQRLIHHLVDERGVLPPRPMALPSHINQQYLMYDEEYGRHEPPPAHHRMPPAGAVHSRVHPMPAAEAPPTVPTLTTPLMQTSQPNDTLFERYPIVWQGTLSLKNDVANVQMHFVHGSKFIAKDSLPRNEGSNAAILKIAQRMRLETSQLEGVTRKIQADKEHCVLLAVPCGTNENDIIVQSSSLYGGFHNYLTQKSAAGIVNTQSQENPQATHSYVVHIFPSCKYATDQLGLIAPDLMSRVNDNPHLMIVVATNT